MQFTDFLTAVGTILAIVLIGLWNMFSMLKGYTLRQFLEDFNIVKPKK